MNYNTTAANTLFIARKFPVELLDRLPACGDTWLFLRAADTEGRGIVEIDLKGIASGLGRSVNTIRNHITQGRKKGLYRDVQQVSGTVYRFFLVNGARIARNLGLRRSIAAVYIEPEAIGDRKIIATEVTARVLQGRSAYKAYRKYRTREKISLESFVKSFQSSDTCRGQAVWCGSRYLFITGKVPQYGGSQKGIGKLIERHESTIQRRLANTQKKQIAVRKPGWTPSKFEAAKKDFYWDSELNRMFVNSGYVWKTGCNIYIVGHAQASVRRWNRKIRMEAEE